MPEQSYRAFISYSHRDDAIARTLHRRLETYRLPKHLIGSETPRGPLPKQLTPIFRDLDELSAADDLSAEIKAALARSEVLIILASPAAKASKWVNLEIETFRALHGNSRPVLVALIEGEPAEAFPPALTAYGQEPVAADFRKSAPGGKRLALLKLVAGITAAPLDALVQRDAQRQYRRVMAITGSALTAVLVMALLLVVALRSQAEAQRQRQEAEGLVEYMLTDLRDRLKGVGRLDVMTAVNERAMKYYGGDTVKAQLLKARTLLAVGEDQDTRGNNKLASENFRNAHLISAKLIARFPNSTDAIFTHAQSEYWLGYQMFKKKKIDRAQQYFESYRRLATKLVDIDPKNSKWRKELSYAEGNLCSIFLEEPKNLPAATRHCEFASNQIELIYLKNKNDSMIVSDLANRYAWQSEAYVATGNLKQSINLRKKQIILLNSILDKNQINIEFLQNLMLAELGLSKLYLNMSNYKMAKQHSINAKRIINNIIRIDGDNNNWTIWNNQIKSITHKTRKV